MEKDMSSRALVGFFVGKGCLLIVIEKGRMKASAGKAVSLKVGVLAWLTGLKIME